jgi:hypothetical protein
MRENPLFMRDTANLKREKIFSFLFILRLGRREIGALFYVQNSLVKIDATAEQTTPPATSRNRRKQLKRKDFKAI